MTNTQLDTTLERYETAIKSLSPADSAINVDQVIAVLNARDAVQVALKEEKYVSNSRLQKIITLDAALREKAKLITSVINSRTLEELANWRDSVQPNARAWWWYLEKIVPPHREVWDWWWQILMLAGWTTNLSLLVNITIRFFGGGAGIGLGESAVIILPSILTLLQANSEFTTSGQQQFEKVLIHLKIRKQYQQQAKLVSTLMMSGLLVSVWLLLPSFSRFYNRRGIINFHHKNLGAAEQDYRRAISLNADNNQAHFNLGNLYEDWQDWEKAKKEYQIAIAGDIPSAYNNLARLYIQEKQYPKAASLLTQGLLLADQKNSQSDVRYSLLKNLGWVRLDQGRYEEAQQTLQAAIGITNNPEAAKYITSLGSAHCLLAQVLEKQKQSTTLEWQKCSQLGSRLNPDEDSWLYLANEKLHQAGK